MNLEIELRPHTGKKNVVGLGEIDVEFDQYMIFITGADYKAATGLDQLHAGYVHKKSVVVDPKTGKQYKPPINWLPVILQWPQAIVDKLSAAVQKALADKGDAGDVALAASNQTRPVSLPPDIPDVVPSPAQSAVDDNNL
jgi:hypothetical protein